MFWRAVTATLFLLLSAQGASAETPSLFEPVVKSKPVNLSRVVFDLAPGQLWGKFRRGVFCIPGGELKWQDERFKATKGADTDAFLGVFRREVRSAGYTSGSDNLFDDEKETAGEFTVGARVKGIDANLCGWVDDAGNIYRYGSATVNVEWQIYSQLRRTIVAVITTSGSFEIRRTTNRDIGPILVGAFGKATESLPQSAEFQKIFRSDPESDSRSASPSVDPNIGIQLLGTSPATSRPISEASGSVVLVLAGGSMGSAFLVSSDGYMITNAHVVGSEKTVRIRWSDGFESDGEVIRAHKARDVALIKTNPHGRQPLALRRGAPTPGTNVFAVGTPLDPKLQGSLTKGIVSANRIMDGFSFIQSDVAVTHGNSGGPLLDEKSTVIGITDLGIAPDGIPQNINLFIPIGDALDFLDLKIAP